MPTQQQIQNTIFSAQLQMANLVEANRVKLVGGTPKGSIDWTAAKWYFLNIKALQRQFTLGDYTSDAAVAIYDCLLSKIGIDPGTNTVDPNYQPSNPSVIIINSNVLNISKIPFATTTGTPVFTLNYSPYKPLYGNSPSLSLYTTVSGEQEDLSTAAIITRATPSDITSDIISISWQFPFATTGYIQITGSGITTAGTAGAGGAITLHFTQSDLLFDAGTSQYYLPLTLPTDYIPFYTSVNGVQVTQGLQYDPSTVPARLFGFANNATQAILIKII